MEKIRWFLIEAEEAIMLEYAIVPVLKTAFCAED